MVSVNPAFLQFAVDNLKVILHTNPFYQPKILSAPKSSRIIELLAFDPSGLQRELRLPTLCPVRALRGKRDKMGPLHKMEQLFVCFGAQALEKPLSKQRLSRWLVQAVEAACKAMGAAKPCEFRAHSTREVSVSWATWKGAELDDLKGSQLSIWRNVRTVL